MIQDLDVVETIMPETPLSQTGQRVAGFIQQVIRVSLEEPLGVPTDSAPHQELLAPHVFPPFLKFKFAASTVRLAVDALIVKLGRQIVQNNPEAAISEQIENEGGLVELDSSLNEELNLLLEFVDIPPLEQQPLPGFESNSQAAKSFAQIATKAALRNQLLINLRAGAEPGSALDLLIDELCRDVEKNHPLEIIDGRELLAELPLEIINSFRDQVTRGKQFLAVLNRENFDETVSVTEIVERIQSKIGVPRGIYFADTLEIVTAAVDSINLKEKEDRSLSDRAFYGVENLPRHLAKRMKSLSIAMQNRTFIERYGVMTRAQYTSNNFASLQKKLNRVENVLHATQDAIVTHLEEVGRLIQSPQAVALGTTATTRRMHPSFPTQEPAFHVGVGYTLRHKHITLDTCLASKVTRISPQLMLKLRLSSEKRSSAHGLFGRVSIRRKHASVEVDNSFSGTYLSRLMVSIPCCEFDLQGTPTVGGLALVHEYDTPPTSWMDLAKNGHSSMGPFSEAYKGSFGGVFTLPFSSLQEELMLDNGDDAIEFSDNNEESPLPLPLPPTKTNNDEQKKIDEVHVSVNPRTTLPAASPRELGWSSAKVTTPFYILLGTVLGFLVFKIIKDYRRK